MIKFITKPKAPKGYGYVLKTGQLEKLLADNNINIHTSVTYYRHLGNVFEARYWLPNQNIDYTRLYITAGMLPSKDILLAREKLEKVEFPRFVEWIMDILALPDNSTNLKHGLCFNSNI